MIATVKEIHTKFRMKQKEIKTMKMKKFMAVLAVAGMMTGMLAGCGSNDSSSDSGNTEATSDWDATNDITIVSREDGSGTRGAFTELFGIVEEVDGEDVDMTTADAQITNNTSVMMTTVAENEYAIGYISLGSLDDSVKALKIDGAEATADNVVNGSYKVSRPFNIAVSKDLNNEVATDFMNFIMSTEGQAVVEEEGYIPVSDVTDFQGTQPSGKAVVGGSSSVSPVMEKLVEAYQEVNPNASIELQTSDSTTGMTNAIEGSYDIGMASRELKEDEASKLDATVMATDGIAVIVNNDNPTEDMTSDQVKAIYTGEVYSWDEIAE